MTAIVYVVDAGGKKKISGETVSRPNPLPDWSVVAWPAVPKPTSRGRLFLFVFFFANPCNGIA